MSISNKNLSKIIICHEEKYLEKCLSIWFLYIFSIFQMWMRRMRDIQRTRFSETLPSTNKRVSCSHLAIFNRFIFEGSSSHSFWTFLGTSPIESNGTRVPFRVWGANFHRLNFVIFESNQESYPATQCCSPNVVDDSTFIQIVGSETLMGLMEKL